MGIIRYNINYVIKLLEENKETALEKVNNMPVLSEYSIEFYKGQADAFAHAIDLLKIALDVDED